MHPTSLPLLVAIVVSVAALAGCATPQYQTRVRLIPPADAPGLACVNSCESKKTACQQDCTARYEACRMDVEPLVEARYADALKQYENALRQYVTALRHYEIRQQLDWMNHSYAPYPHPFWWEPMPRAYFPFPYRVPVMPTRDTVRERLLEENCQADCRCLPAYDTCFVGCGGQRLSETVCVKNCPPTK